MLSEEHVASGDVSMDLPCLSCRLKSLEEHGGPPFVFVWLNSFRAINSTIKGLMWSGKVGLKSMLLMSTSFSF